MKTIERPPLPEPGDTDAHNLPECESCGELFDGDGSECECCIEDGRAAYMREHDSRGER
jgi:hypothetical protein